MRSEQQGSDAWRKRAGESEVGTFRERRAWAWLNPAGSREAGYEWETGNLVPLCLSALFGLFAGPYLLATILWYKPGYFVAAVVAVAVLGLAAALAHPLRGLGLHAFGIAITAALMAVGGAVATPLVSALGSDAVDRYLHGAIAALVSVVIAMASSYAAWRIVGRVGRRHPVQ